MQDAWLYSNGIYLLLYNKHMDSLLDIIKNASWLLNALFLCADISLMEFSVSMLSLNPEHILKWSSNKDDITQDFNDWTFCTMSLLYYKEVKLQQVWQFVDIVYNIFLAWLKNVWPRLKSSTY